MRDAMSLTVLLTVKLFSTLFYRTTTRWIGERPKQPAKDLRLMVLLNHTSLFEPLYLGAIPLSLLWPIASRGSVPGADITLDRPLIGRFFKSLAPSVVTITRQRDASWEGYLNSITPETLILIAPEGRMKRPNGLDKHGQPMTVRGGIADLLSRMDKGRMILVYSGGLHHVHTPGQKLPRLFKRLRLAFESIDIAEYRKTLGDFSFNDAAGLREFKRAVIADLERRRDRECSSLAVT